MIGTGIESRYTEQQIREVITNSTSISQVLKLLGIKGRGRYYEKVKAFITKYNIDISHFGTQHRYSSLDTKITPRYPKYTEENLTEVVESSYSISQVLQKLGVKSAGGNYQTIKKNIKKYNIDTSHFTGQASNRDKVLGPKRTIEEYLTNKVYITSHKLKYRLIAEGIKEYKCESCGLSEWLGNPIPLELHHINGEHSDNTLSNLQILCANCHSFTLTFRGKKNRK